jgi:hypothetical protein
VAIEPAEPVEFETVVQRARGRAAATGELRPVVSGSFATAVPAELGDFVHRIISEGVYERAVEDIGDEDPDLANV